MSSNTTFEQLADQAEGRICSLVAGLREESCVDDFHVAGRNSALVLVDPELRIVVVPGIITPRMFWELRDDVVELEISALPSLGCPKVYISTVIPKFRRVVPSKADTAPPKL